MSVIEIGRLLRAEVVESFMDVSVKPGETTEPEKLESTWEVQAYNSFQMFI